MRSLIPAIVSSELNVLTSWQANVRRRLSKWKDKHMKLNKNNFFNVSQQNWLFHVLGSIFFFSKVKRTEITVSHIAFLKESIACQQEWGVWRQTFTWSKPKRGNFWATFSLWICYSRLTTYHTRKVHFHWLKVLRSTFLSKNCNMKKL